MNIRISKKIAQTACLLALVLGISALAQLRAQTNTDFNVLYSLRDDNGFGAAFGWGDSVPCPEIGENWNGVFCRGTNKVEELKLTCGDTKLSAPFPIKIAGLTGLSVLELRSCYTNGIQATQFAARCPTDTNTPEHKILCGGSSSIGFYAPLGKMFQLQQIRFDTGQTINGTIDEMFRESETPPFQSNMIPTKFVSLQLLYLTDTKMSGVIPAGIMQFSGTAEFRLNYNSFSGELPAAGNPSKNIRLNGNQLEGVLPDYIVNADAGSTVYVRYNKFDVENTPPGNIDTLDPLWRITQTVPPTNVQVQPNGAGSALLTWTPIAYQAHGGYYEVLSSPTPGGPYTSRGTTQDSGGKTASSLSVSGLLGGTHYFIVRTFTPAHMGVFPQGCTQEVDCVTENNPNDLISVNSMEASAQIQANVWTVTKTDDTDDNSCSPSDCSLREAVAAANASPESDAIEFDQSVFAGTQSITLTQGELGIANNGALYVNGTGAERLSISGGGQSRVFFVNSGADLTLNNLTITGGSVSGAFDSRNYGGGIYNSGTLTITNSTVDNNHVRGGAFSRNYGGGIYTQNGILTITNSTVSGNSVGGFRHEDNYGGGIFISSGTVNITNSTISGNFMGPSNFNASNNGGGINNGGGTVRARNTIIASNSAYGGPDFHGTLTSLGYNLIGDTNNTNITGTTTGNITGQSARLAPLGFYGGKTITHALLSGSPAINAGNDCVLTQSCPTYNAPTALTTDQRGASRVGTVDIGAFEVNNSANGGSYRAVLPTGKQDEAYSFTLVANKGLFDYLVSDGNLPNGIELDVVNGSIVLSGIPTENGVFDFSVTASDGVNSVVTGYTLEIVLSDSTPPVITPNVSGTLGNNGWYVSDVQVSWSVTDDESSISNQSGCDMQNVTTDTNGTTFTCEATSTGGTDSKSVTIKRDATAPTITFASRTAANGNGWNNSDVTVNWNCSDAMSDEISPSVSQTVSAEGANQSATGTCTDNAGNTAQDTQTGINIDKTSPSISFVSHTPAANANGWNNSDVTVNWSCSDALSGAANQSVSQIVSSEGANQSAIGTCGDLAGNTAQDTQSGINIDKTVPVTSFVSHTPPPNAKGWNNTSVTIIWSCSDALSGTMGTSVSQTLTQEGANLSATGTCFDLAGNSASNTQTGINIDKTPSVINPYANIMVNLPAKSSATSMAVDFALPTASDNLSTPMVITNPVSGEPFPVGTTVVNIKATDAADNQSFSSFTVTVQYQFSWFYYSGFLLSEQQLNQVTAGSDVPVRFTLSGNKGDPYSSPPTSQQISCSTFAPTAEAKAINRYAPDPYYSSLYDFYQTTWRTQVNWRFTCRRLLLQMKDGTTKSLNFYFK